MSAAIVTSLRGGQRFTAVTTGTNNGERFFRTREYVAFHDQDVQQFCIPIADGRVAQDCVFVEQATRFAEMPTVSIPVLVVTGSISADLVSP